MNDPMSFDKAIEETQKKKNILSLSTFSVIGVASVLLLVLGAYVTELTGELPTNILIFFFLFFSFFLSSFLVFYMPLFERKQWLTAKELKKYLDHLQELPDNEYSCILPSSYRYNLTDSLCLIIWGKPRVRKTTWSLHSETSGCIISGFIGDHRYKRIYNSISDRLIELMKAKGDLDNSN